MRSVLTLFVCATGLFAEPCVKGAGECTEKVPLGTDDRYVLVYRSYPLTIRNDAIERAVIVVHGAGRNADDYFESMMAATFLAGALDKALVVSPRYASKHQGCHDELAPGEISWTCSGKDDWRGGGPAADGAGVMAFDLIDKLLRTFANRDLFPGMKQIVVTGHSAGGQFVNRYAAIGKAENSLRVPVKYIVANPSSYVYLDGTRLRPGAECSTKGGCTGAFTEYREGRNCTTYNLWKYGLDELSGYAAQWKPEEIRIQLAARSVIYLLGEFDTLPVYGFDSSCPAMAQGASRLERGINYWNYVNSKYGANHTLKIVPACGHNGRCMYTAQEALALLFGD